MTIRWLTLLSARRLPTIEIGEMGSVMPTGQRLLGQAGRL
jgi:hypothetical protein